MAIKHRLHQYHLRMVFVVGVHVVAVKTHVGAGQLYIDHGLYLEVIQHLLIGKGLYDYKRSPII